MAAVDAAAPGGGTTGRLFQGVARNEFGFKMLQSMGWSEGQARARTQQARGGCGCDESCASQR
jgi:hypothetical protein